VRRNPLSPVYFQVIRTKRLRRQEKEEIHTRLYKDKSGGSAFIPRRYGTTLRRAGRRQASALPSTIGRYHRTAVEITTASAAPRFGLSLTLLELVLVRFCQRGRFCSRLVEGSPGWAPPTEATQGDEAGAREEGSLVTSQSCDVSRTTLYLIYTRPALWPGPGWKPDGSAALASRAECLAPT